AGDALAAAVLNDGLGDGEDVRLGEGAVQRRTAVAARAEADELVGVADVGASLKIFALQFGDVGEHIGRRGLAGEGVYGHGTGPFGGRPGDRTPPSVAPPRMSLPGAGRAAQRRGRSDAWPTFPSPGSIPPA